MAQAGLQIRPTVTGLEHVVTDTRTFVRALVLSVLLIGSGRIANPAHGAAPLPSQPAQWQPGAGSPKANIQTVDGVRALRFQCNFAGTKHARASWDANVAVDLGNAQGIRFRMRCANARPVRNFSFYLQSGKGWYVRQVSAPDPGTWATVELRKHNFSFEEEPAGWSKVSRMRISAWRGLDQDTEFHIADMEVIPASGTVALVIADSAPTAQKRSVAQFTREMGNHLSELGVNFDILSDRDITTATLAPYRLLVLSYNPTMPDAAQQAVTKAVSAEKLKLLAFFVLPPRLQQAIGFKIARFMSEQRPGYFATIRKAPGMLKGAPSAVRQASWNIQVAEPARPDCRVAAWWHDRDGRRNHPAVLTSTSGAYLSHVLLKDDQDAKRMLLLAMAGDLVPSVWRDSALAQVSRVGKFGAFDGVDSVREYLAERGGRDRDFKALATAALSRHSTAKSLATKGRYPEAIAVAQDADAALLKAWCASLVPKKGEFRAFWCHKATGPGNGASWDESIRLMAQNGFTAIVPNMCWGGVAFYPSEVLPVHPSVKDQGDQVAACLAACRKYGVECHVWKVCFKMGGHTPKTFVDRMSTAGRVNVSRAGKPDARWLSPSCAANQDLEIRAMVELARNYKLDGIHFDYIRYPGAEYCYGKESRRRFEAELGRQVSGWPGDVLREGELRRKWLEFRRSQVTRVVAEVSRQARQVRPGIEISAAVFPDWRSCRDSVGQDWKTWCDKGYLDFVCPMDYTESTVGFAGAVSKQLKHAGRIPCYPGIGLSTWSQFDLPKLVDQICVTRELKAPGFIIFEYRPGVAEDVLPMLGMGLTRE